MAAQDRANGPCWDPGDRTDPVLTFPGQGTGASNRSKGCLFSASNVASFWGLTVIILAIGMAVIMTRK